MKILNFFFFKVSCFHFRFTWLACRNDMMASGANWIKNQKSLEGH